MLSSLISKKSNKKSTCKPQRVSFVSKRPSIESHKSQAHYLKEELKIKKCLESRMDENNVRK